MADTIPDITIGNDVFYSVNSLSGIAVGTEIIISNKSNSTVLIQVKNTQPSSASTAGVVMHTPPNETSIKTVTAGENEVWVRSLMFEDVKLSIQAR